MARKYSMHNHAPLTHQEALKNAGLKDLPLKEAGKQMVCCKCGCAGGTLAWIEKGRGVPTKYQHSPVCPAGKEIK